MLALLISNLTPCEYANAIWVHHLTARVLTDKDWGPGGAIRSAIQCSIARSIIPSLHGTMTNPNETRVGLSDRTRVPSSADQIDDDDVTSGCRSGCRCQSHSPPISGHSGPQRAVRYLDL